MAYALRRISPCSVCPELSGDTAALVSTNSAMLGQPMRYALQVMSRAEVVRLLMTIGLFSMDEKKPPWRYLGIHKVLDVFTWLVRWRLSGLQFGEAVASMCGIDTAVLLGLGGPKQH